MRSLAVPVKGGSGWRMNAAARCYGYAAAQTRTVRATVQEVQRGDLSGARAESGNADWR